MSRYLKLSPGLRQRFPDLNAEIIRFSGVHVARESPQLEDYKGEVAHRIRNRWNLDQLKDDPMFRVYRDFFWRLR